MNIMLSFNVVSNSNADTALILLQKSVILIDSKYEVPFSRFAPERRARTRFLLGLDVAHRTLLAFKDEIISLKNPMVLNKVDLAREERVLKHDRLLELLASISQLARVQKILREGKQTVLFSPS